MSSTQEVRSGLVTGIIQATSVCLASVLLLDTHRTFVEISTFILYCNDITEQSTSFSNVPVESSCNAVSYTHLDVYKRQS